MKELRKKDRDSLLAEIEELRKSAIKKPLIDQVTKALQFTPNNVLKEADVKESLFFERPCRYFSLQG